MVQTHGLKKSVSVPKYPKMKSIYRVDVLFDVAHTKRYICQMSVPSYSLEVHGLGIEDRL